MSPIRARNDVMQTAIQVPLRDEGALDGDLVVPADATGLVLFAHGSGSSRHSPRNQMVARVLQAHAHATLLLDLLTPAEEKADALTRHLRFDIGLLSRRLSVAVRFAHDSAEPAGLPVGLFGASTGAAAALVTAAHADLGIGAVVSRGGRPDLAGEALRHVRAPTLLLVGGADREVLDLNRRALAQLPGSARLEVVPGASHLFSEPGALEMVAEHAAAWFTTHLVPR